MELLAAHSGSSGTMYWISDKERIESQVLDDSNIDSFKGLDLSNQTQSLGD